MYKQRTLGHAFVVFAANDLVDKLDIPKEDVIHVRDLFLDTVRIAYNNNLIKRRDTYDPDFTHVQAVNILRDLYSGSRDFEVQV